MRNHDRVNDLIFFFFGRTDHTFFVWDSEEPKQEDDISKEVYPKGQNNPRPRF